MTDKRPLEREPFVVTQDELRRLAPTADATIIAGLAAASALMEDHGLAASELRLAHFLAQAAHESAGFTTLTERGSDAYFARRYGARRDLGNRDGEDGVRYRGRGLFQLTGRDNYRRYGDLLGLDLETRPEQAARPDISLRIALEYWRRNDLNRAADANDIRLVTRRINGGSNGLADRRRYFERALAIFADSGATDGAPLRIGAVGTPVVRLQQRLAARGHQLCIDGLFGRETRAALRAFQRAQGLAADGICGPQTRAALEVPTRSTTIEKETPMQEWKSYLKSRAIWANAIALAAFGLNVAGIASLSAETQAQLVDAALKAVEVGGLVTGIYFRAVATNRLGPNLL